MENIKRIDYYSEKAGEEFASSLHHTGFAVFYNHPIAEDKIKDLYNAWQEFFLSDNLKKKPFIVNPKNQRGWVPPSIAEVAKGAKIRDLKEFYNYYQDGICPPQLKKLTEQLYHQLLTVGEMLLTWLQEQTPKNIKQQFSESLPDMVKNSDMNLFRINYYPALTGNEQQGAIRAAQHTDIDLLTVLTAGTSGGLQALDKNGEYHDIPCEHGNLVINTGDMLQECSNKYYPSTVHRVLNPEGETKSEARMSCPMFIHPRENVFLSKNHSAGSYLHERLVELGLRSADS